MDVNAISFDQIAPFLTGIGRIFTFKAEVQKGQVKNAEPIKLIEGEFQNGV